LSLTVTLQFIRFRQPQTASTPLGIARKEVKRGGGKSPKSLHAHDDIRTDFCLRSQSNRHANYVKLMTTFFRCYNIDKVNAAFICIVASGTCRPVVLLSHWRSRYRVVIAFRRSATILSNMVATAFSLPQWSFY
jgi:hypothetical protein